LDGIFLGEGESLSGDIEAEVSVLGLVTGEGEGNGSGSCADIDDQAWGKLLEEAGGVFDKKFCFWAGDEGGVTAD
jgi:hypothetical protein